MFFSTQIASRHKLPNLIISVLVSRCLPYRKSSMCVLVCVSKLLDSLFSSMGLSVFLRINALFVCFLSQVSFSVCKIKLPHFIFFFQNVLTLFGPLLFHLPFRIRLLSLKKKKNLLDIQIKNSLNLYISSENFIRTILSLPL